MPHSNANLVKTWLPNHGLHDEALGASPTEAAFSIVRQRVPRRLRAGVAGAIPVLPTDDFAAAARIIREAAERIE